MGEKCLFPILYYESLTEKTNSRQSCDPCSHSAVHDYLKIHLLQIHAFLTFIIFLNSIPYTAGGKNTFRKKKGEKEIKFFGVISVGTYQLGRFQFSSIFLHREIKQHIKDEFWSCLPFLFFCHYICSYDFNYSYITSSMKSLRSDEFWNSEFVKITWSIYHTLCNTQGSMGAIPYNQIN